MPWLLLYLVPKNILSRLCGVLARVKWPDGMRLCLLKWFARRYRINLKEAEHPIERYGSIQDLFTRRLKPGARPVANEKVVHPVDGLLTVAETIKRSCLIQVKGWTYPIEEFLKEDGKAFEGGVQLTYYLCPTDYHRVHSPVDGLIEGVHHIPGDLWPVNDWSVNHIRGLFARNERVVIWIKTSSARIALVMVGATNVGQMTLAFDQKLITNKGRRVQKKMYENLTIKRGEELGVFNMGSTVVVLYPAGFLIGAGFEVPRSSRMGEALY